MSPGPARPARPIVPIGLAVTLVTLGGCHDPEAPPRATPPVQVSELVLEHMGRGGQVRRVIYEPPPDLAAPDPEEIELPFPGPGVDGEPPVPGEEVEDEPGDEAEEEAGEEAGDETENDPEDDPGAETDPDTAR